MYAVTKHLSINLLLGTQIISLQFENGGKITLITGKNSLTKEKNQGDNDLNVVGHLS